MAVEWRSAANPREPLTVVPEHLYASPDRREVAKKVDGSFSVVKPANVMSLL
jgi:hypothetical protein